MLYGSLSDVEKYCRQRKTGWEKLARRPTFLIHNSFKLRSFLLSFPLHKPRTHTYTHTHTHTHTIILSACVMIWAGCDFLGFGGGGCAVINCQIESRWRHRYILRENSWPFVSVTSLKPIIPKLLTREAALFKNRRQELCCVRLFTAANAILYATWQESGIAYCTVKTCV